MERNLGAMNNTPGDANGLGLLYQWGRKDPFTSSSSVTAALPKPVYDLAGTTEVPLEIEPTDRVMNLINAIQHPFKFFSTNVWYTNDLTSIYSQRRDLWDSSVVGKTHFDPCPEGWIIPMDTYLFYVNPENYVAGEGLYAGSVGFFPKVPLRLAAGSLAITDALYATGRTAFTGSVGNYAYLIKYTSTAVGDSFAAPSCACPVRCVKIE
jgi:hypothetical protein